MIKTTINLSPDIYQYFDKKLLDYDMWSAAHLQITGSLYEAAKRRYKPGSRKLRKYEQLMQVFSELYEWYKKKEKNRKTTQADFTEEPFDADSIAYNIKGSVGKIIRESFPRKI